MTHVFAPLFEGPLVEDKPPARSLLLRRHPLNGQPMTREAYVDAVELAAEKHPRLVRNIVRGHLAAALAADAHRQGRPSQLAVADATRQRIEGYDPLGSEVLAQIWAEAVPKEWMHGLPAPLILRQGHCTRSDVRALLAGTKSDDALSLVTHPYHAQRAWSVAKRVDPVRPIHLESTNRDLSSLHLDDADRRYLTDLVRVGAPSESESRRLKIGHELKRVAEFMFSRPIEKLTGGRFVPEEVIAAELHKRSAPSLHGAKFTDSSYHPD